ncbi:uncharacterized protein LOC112555094 isoform X2 [Pomacea canaliculata]|uniref:uncharacterized protein LOC112555094 isoform X2 n=1 Tax=Pomacea canaliculata TaxID=400727 RepID=UPI000D72924C|nr:uncharacterized protein LOC112555094 isoform X2 [Pomacea canaliculata]
MAGGSALHGSCKSRSAAVSVECLMIQPLISQPNIPGGIRLANSRPSMSESSKPAMTGAAPRRSETNTQVSRRGCVHEELISGYIQKKVQEERFQYDKALVRANTLLIQTRQLREEMKSLTNEFDQLESRFQRVKDMNLDFQSAARTRLDYLDNESYLASIIAYLMAQHRNKDMLVPMVYSPKDWNVLKIQKVQCRRKRSRREKLFSKIFCGKSGGED